MPSFARSRRLLFAVALAAVLAAPLAGCRKGLPGGKPLW
jgi:hypothetical protein